MQKCPAVADFGKVYVLSQCVLQREKWGKVSYMKKLCSLKVLVVSTGFFDSKTYEGLSPGQYLLEFIIKRDFWEGNLWFRCSGTLKGKGVLPYTVPVTPPLAALPKDDLNKVFTPKLKTFEFWDVFFQRLDNTREAWSRCACETESTAIWSSCLSQDGLTAGPRQRRATCKEEQRATSALL